jgi:hypothetical protein
MREGKKKDQKEEEENASIFSFKVFKFLLPVAESRLRFMFTFGGCWKIMCSELVPTNLDALL